MTLQLARHMINLYACYKGESKDIEESKKNDSWNLYFSAFKIAIRIGPELSAQVSIGARQNTCRY